MGAVHDSNSRCLDPRKKLHRFPINQGDVFQIEENATLCLDVQQLLQPLRMFMVQFSAQGEDRRVGSCRPLNSVCQWSPSLDEEEGNMRTNLKLLILFGAGIYVRKFLAQGRKNIAFAEPRGQRGPNLSGRREAATIEMEKLDIPAWKKGCLAARS
jgi:hypothetical protein